MSNYYNGHLDALATFMIQPLLLYQDADEDLHLMSRSITLPTQSSGKKIDLVMTSLSNEIVTPAYKKFVAVTDFVKSGSTTDWQHNGDSYAKSVINSINGKQGENGIGKVLDGSQKKITFNAPEDGTYELLLSTIDYDGHILNRKFYVKVGM